MEVFNKRRVLSVIAGIYDPLGLVGPVTFWCKHFMQILWLTGTSWDDPLSDSLSNQWVELYSQLISDTYFKIPRLSLIHISFHSHISNNICQLCRGRHRLSECPQFVAISPLERKNILTKYKLCLNCIRPGHDLAHCPSKFACRTCAKRHHTCLLYTSRCV